MSATVLCHDIKTTHVSASEVNIPGQPYGLSANHDPAYRFGVPSESDRSAAGFPLGFNRHDYREDLIEISFAMVSTAVRDALVVLLEHARENYEVVYSPLGSTSYGSEEYLLTSTSADLTQTSYGRWSGRVTMQRKGSVY